MEVGVEFLCYRCSVYLGKKAKSTQEINILLHTYIFSNLYLHVSVNGSFIKDGPQETGFSLIDKTQQNQRIGNKKDILCCHRPNREIGISTKYNSFSLAEVCDSSHTEYHILEKGDCPYSSDSHLLVVIWNLQN